MATPSIRTTVYRYASRCWVGPFDGEKDPEIVRIAASLADYGVTAKVLHDLNDHADDDIFAGLMAAAARAKREQFDREWNARAAAGAPR